MKDKLRKFGSEEDFLASIERTAKEMAAPPGADTRALALKAAKAYREGREKAFKSGSRQEREDAFERETAILARTVADGLTPSGRDSWYYALLALSPEAILLISYLYNWPFTSALMVALVVPISIAALAYVISDLRTESQKRIFLWRSVAVLLGVFIGSSALAYFAFHTTRASQHTAVAPAQNALSDLAILAMENLEKNKEGLFITTSIMKDKNVVEYTATGGNLEGTLVVQVGPEKGKLFSQDHDGVKDKSEFVFGEVVGFDKAKGFYLKLPDRPKIWVGIGPDYPVQRPKLGSFIIVEIDLLTGNARKIKQVSDEESDH